MGDTVATFLGCQDAIATAAATCPDCGRTGTVPVSTEVVVHKTILCTDCADLKVAAATRADSASGEQASEGREVAVSHVGASQGQETPNSHLATEGDFDALAPDLSPAGEICGAEGWGQTCGLPEGHPLPHRQVCADCKGEPELSLLTNPPILKCFNCCLIAAMKRPCSICGQHITEAITRALDEQGKPNTIGTCLQCLMKAAAAQRN